MIETENYWLKSCLKQTSARITIEYTVNFGQA